MFYDIGNASADWTYPNGLSSTKQASGLVVRTTGNHSRKVVYFGDSNVEQYWPRVRHLVKDTPIDRTVVFLTTGGCLPIRGIRESAHPNCNGFAEAAANYIEAHEVTDVVLSASWLAYFRGSNYYFGDEQTGALSPHSEGSEKAFGELTLMMKSFSASGKKVWLILKMK